MRAQRELEAAAVVFDADRLAVFAVERAAFFAVVVVAFAPAFAAFVVEVMPALAVCAVLVTVSVADEAAERTSSARRRAVKDPVGALVGQSALVNRATRSWTAVTLP